MKNESKNKVGEKIYGRRMEKKRLWEKAQECLISLYGEMPDIAILNRFYSEKMQFEKDYSVLLWELVAKIKHRGREMGYCVSLGGTLGSSFVAYLLGATDTNPLPLHYTCQKCKRVEFVNEKLLPLDLVPKECQCGGKMIGDGYDIPYEMHIGVSETPSAPLWIDPDFIGDAEQIIRENMKSFRIFTLIDRESNPIKYAFLPFGKDGNICGEEDKSRIFAGLTVTPLATHKYAGLLAKECGVNFYSVLESLNEKISADPQITKMFLSGKVNKIPYFRLPALNMSRVIMSAKPKNSYDLLKVFGAVHGTNTWKNNAAGLIETGVCSIDEIPTHRDDIFMMLRDRLANEGYSDFGIAFEITNKMRRGSFGKSGIDPRSHAIMEYLSPTEWFISYAEKIHYMFPKAHSAQNLIYAYAFMWYRVNFPDVYDRVMKEVLNV